MHRIDTSTAQVDKFGSGKNGFTGGNPQTGVLPTALDADYFDSIQEELAGVIEAAGISLKKDTNTQLLSALKSLFTGRQIGAPIVMTSTGIYTPSSAAIKFVEVELYAPGGGGAGVPASTAGSTANVGGGASAGSWAKFRVPASLVAAGILVTIGVGGAAGGKTGSGGAGSNGGISSFGSLVSCPGGLGSNYSTTNASISAGGAESPLAPTISSSVMLICSSRGQSGNPGYILALGTGASGLGGSSPIGAGGSGNGGAGSGKGSGGAGNRSFNGDTTAKAGGDGADGFCLIRELA